MLTRQIVEPGLEGAVEGLVDSGRAVEDGDGCRFVALQPERHCAEAEAGEMEPGAAETDVVHGAPRVTGMRGIGK